MIIFLSSSPFLGGAEYQLLDLISGLTRKYAIKIVCPSTSPLKNSLPNKEIEVENIEFGATLGKFRGLNILDFHNLLRVMQLKKLLSSFNPSSKDFLVTYDYKELILASLAREKIKTIHFQHPQFPRWLILNPVLKSLAVNCMNRTSKIVVDCHAVKDHLQDLGVREGKIEVIYNGVDEHMFVPVTLEEKNKIRKELGLVGKQIIGINARVNAGKGYETLVSAFKQITTEFPDTYLISVGGGNLYIQKKIDYLVNRLGLSERIRFLGEWDRDKTPDFYKAIDIFTLPSETEGLPLTVIEAMLSGLPVIGTTVGGIPEEVVDGKTGFLIPPKNPDRLAEATIKLLGNRILSQKMGEEGSKVALQKFTKKSMIKNTLNLLTKLEAK